jgi:hypothetical protein
MGRALTFEKSTPDLFSPIEGKGRKHDFENQGILAFQRKAEPNPSTV